MIQTQTLQIDNFATQTSIKTRKKTLKATDSKQISAGKPLILKFLSGY